MRLIEESESDRLVAHRFRDIAARLCVDEAQIGIYCNQRLSESARHLKGHRRRTPKKADNADEHVAKLRRHKCKIDDLRGGIHRPTSVRVQVGLGGQRNEVNTPASQQSWRIHLDKSTPAGYSSEKDDAQCSNHPQHQIRPCLP